MPSSDNRQDLLSIILSFRNEEAVIPELIRRIVAAVGQCNADYEMIFVNDDSTDRSLELLRRYAAENPRIKIINMSRRFGVAECLIAGMERCRGDAVIYLDCDLQDPPELFTKLVAEWKKGADVVYTVRSKRLNESPLKLFATGIGYRLIGAFSEVKLPVEAGDFRLLSRRVVDHLLRLPESDPYVRGLTTWVGFRQAAVEYERQPRLAGMSHFPLLTNANPLKTLFFGITSFSMLPLYMIFFIGLIMTAVSSLALVSAAAAALFHLVDMTPAVMSFFVFLWSTSMMALGVVGLYLSRIYKDVRGRPRYIVADTIGFQDN